METETLPEPVDGIWGHLILTEESAEEESLDWTKQTVKGWEMTEWKKRQFCMYGTEHEAVSNLFYFFINTSLSTKLNVPVWEITETSEW